MPNIKEFLFGTPQEISARKTKGNLERRKSLTQREQEKLKEAAFLSRRLILRQLIVGGTASVVAATGGVWIWGTRPPKQESVNVAEVKVINDNLVFGKPIPNPDQVVINGFGFVTVSPNKAYTVFFAEFDEIATDTVSSFILDKGKHKVVFGYFNAAVFRKLLDSIGFPGDKFAEYHRNSNLRVFARELGEYSSRSTKLPLKSEEDAIVTGLKIMRIFGSGRPEEVDVYFPGFTSNILGTPPALIR